jgi:flagellar protein FliS
MITQQDLDRWRVSQIRTQSPMGLVVMLFDALLLKVEEGRQAIHGGQIEPAHNALMAAQDMLGGLSAVLNPDWGPTVNLRQLYSFARRRIMDANFKKAAEPLDEVTPMLKTLRDTFAQVAETSPSGQTAVEEGKESPRSLDFAG